MRGVPKGGAYRDTKIVALGYYVSTVGINEQSIVNYIRDQEKHNKMTDQLSLIEDRDPFKGSQETMRKSEHAAFRLSPHQALTVPDQTAL